MRTVLLYGDLAKQFGREHRFAIRNAAEAVRALCANFRTFETAIMNADRSGYKFKVVVGKDDIDQTQLHELSSDRDTIRIIPVVAGSGAVGRIIAGALLIAASFIPGLQALSIGAISLAQASATIGASLLIGGVAQLLAGPPPSRQKEEERRSSVFSGPVNTTQQGVPIPVGYGRMFIGSVVISAGIITSDQA